MRLSHARSGCYRTGGSDHYKVSVAVHCRQYHSLRFNAHHFARLEVGYEADLFPYKHRRILIGEGDAAQDRAFLHAVFNEELEQFLRFLHFGAFQNFSYTDVNFVEVFVAAGLLDRFRFPGCGFVGFLCVKKFLYLCLYGGVFDFLEEKVRL